MQAYDSLLVNGALQSSPSQVTTELRNLTFALTWPILDTVKPPDGVLETRLFRYTPGREINRFVT